MPGGGEITLVAYGNQNILINGNPEMTYFYRVFKRYTHFSQESITVPLDGPNELMLDTPIRIRAKIPRHGDLLTNLDFVFRIPEIYSKVWVDSSGTRIPAFRWIHMLGPTLIDNVAIFVGGSKIQEFPGEWIAARAAADMPADKYLKWRTLVGDMPELHTPEWGLYGKAVNYPFQRGEYPHVIADASGAETAPSIQGNTIRVPLPFWFSESYGTALPLVSLQLHEVEVQITLRTIREIYRIMDLSIQREPNRSGRSLIIDPTKPTSINPAFPADGDNLTFQYNYAPVSDIRDSMRYFFTDVSEAVPIQDGFIMNARLEGNFIYLTEKERIMFASKELWGLVHQVQTFRFPNVVTRSRLDLDAHGLAHRILFFARRSDAIIMRNDYTNLSNWKSLSQAPYWPITGSGGVANSGRLMPYTQRDILRAARMIGAGNDMFEEKPAQFFEVQHPYNTTTGGGVAGLHSGSGIRPEEIMGPIYQIPFALNASDHVQPSGTFNMSRVREIQLEVEPWPIDPMAPYTYDFTVYVESLNMIKYLNGMAGLGFAI